MPERDWEAELSAAAAADSAEQSPFDSTGTPEGEPTPQVQPEAPSPVEPSVPDVQAPAEPVSADTFDGGAFNPDTLPPELQPGWRQLQAAFTRKTQEMAEERRQFEAQAATLGDPEQVQQAMELFSAMQDPQNWVQLHQELSAAMEQYGLTPAEARQAATEAMTQAPPAVPDPGDLDPELAPLVQQLQAQQARLDAFEAQQRAAQMQHAAELEHQQIVNELMADVTEIRQANPNYTDEDIDVILAHSSFFNGDVKAAQANLEGYFTARLGRYLDTKQGAQSIASSVPPGGSPAASTPVEGGEDETLEDVERWATEHIRQLQAAGQFD
jgi:hypothetical protein